jgi:hypothetical protein
MKDGFRYPAPYSTPVNEVKLIIRINQADKASILRGISPKNDPPLIISSTLPVVKHLTAMNPVIRETRKTENMLTKGLILTGTKESTNIPENKTIANVLNRKPINSLPS